ncbi:MAG: Flp family type IVb pilin [Notoacmeibacter sp.]
MAIVPGILPMMLDALKSSLMRFAKDKRGATAVEYGLIVSVVSLSIVGSANLVWVEMKESFFFIAATLKNG